MSEADLRQMLRDCGFSIANLSYRLEGADDAFEYRMMLRTTQAENLPRLAARLNQQLNVLEFRISPTGD
jgi:putative Mg2+ transporter-C (MgtC) family protein